MDYYSPRELTKRRQLQGIRNYSAGASPPKKSLAPIYATVGAVGLGIGIYRYNYAGTGFAEQKEREKAFKGGDQGFISLKLASSEDLSHDTKRLRFALPDKESVAGLPITCK